MDNRKITTFYEDVDGEREIAVDVEQQDRFTAIVLDDLLGCPEGERDGIRERAVAERLPRSGALAPRGPRRRTKPPDGTSSSCACRSTLSGNCASWPTRAR